MPTCSTKTTCALPVWRDESFAPLGARVTRCIDDDPEFTAALADALYPRVLRPFPSCSIACFEIDASRAAQMSASVVMPHGTEWYSRPVKGAKIFSGPRTTRRCRRCG